MRSVPSNKSQRISESLETYERNITNKAERIVFEESLVDEAICDEQETEIIMKYIHKKFNHSSLTAVLNPEQQRSSVIINSTQFSSQAQDLVDPSQFPQLTSQAPDLVKFNTRQSQEQGKGKEEVEEVEEFRLPATENIDMVDLKDIQTICMSFLAEAPPFMQEKREVFYNAWYQVNMGEECMGYFINYVKKRSSLPLSFFVMSGKQYRERYMSGVCALDLINEISQETLVRVLRERLHHVYILTMIMLANLRGTDNLSSFLLANDDMKQWEEEAAGTEWPTYLEILMATPATEETKLAMKNKMAQHQHPILTDKSVHMMMVVLCLFHNDDRDENVRRVHEVTRAMLRSYLRANHGEAEYSSARILRCVSDLPAIMRLRNQIIEEGKIKDNQHGPGEAKRRKIEFSDS